MMTKLLWGAEPSDGIPSRLQLPSPLPAPTPSVEPGAEVRRICQDPAGLGGPDVTSATPSQSHQCLRSKASQEPRVLQKRTARWEREDQGWERSTTLAVRLCGLGCLPSAAAPAWLSTGCASRGVVLANSALTMWTVKWLLLYFVALSNISQRVGCTIWWTICLCAQQHCT